MRRTGVWVSVFRNSFIHKIFIELLQPLRDFRTQRRWLSSKQRVSPFYHLFNSGSWRHWRRIDSTLILPFSSLTVAWCCRSWWGRRGCGRWRMMTLLSWRCHWCWRMRTGGRTRWQAWNHNRNEVLRVANYPNPVLMRCGFWPLIHS